MTNETRRRINAYRRALPVMRQKVAAAMVILLVAVISTVTSTYAWVTISRAPEVRDITTVLAANGSLEIALSKEDGSLPDEFDIDESLAVNRDVTRTNLLWGNLINLADDRYGTEHVTLRPAQLNQANLLTNPLWGAEYGEDGRVTILNPKYTYVKWDGTAGQFLGSREYGVRAIASYIATVSAGSKLELQEKINAVISATSAVNNKYSVVVSSFAGLGKMISRFAQDKVNGSSFAVDPNDVNSNMGPFIPDMLKLYSALNETMIAQRNAYTALANLQLFQWVKSQQDMQFVPITWKEIADNAADFNVNDPTDASRDGRIKLTGLTDFITDHNKLQKDIDKLNEYEVKRKDPNVNAIYRWNEGGDAGFQISEMITRLINYSSMYVVLGGTKVPVVNLQSLGADLLQYNNSDQNVYITAGIMKRFEDNVIDVNNRLNGNAECTIAIQVKKIITLDYTLKGHAYTEATGVSAFQKDFANASNQELSAQDIVAKDTCGMAIDFWLRTNAEQTCLTLEGATTTNADGTIVSYDGINRVWGSTGEAVLTTESTTQGGGSCYVYYADSPEDMLRSLDLLDAMKVAFVDQHGNLLARASMDTVNYYAVNGRITVPLVLDSDTKTTYTYTNDLNEEVVGLAITTMYTDNPIRVTAIIYLDGKWLTNDDVLASAEIQGQLNLQFGSSTDLKTVGSNDLIDDIRSVTASVTKNEMDYDNHVTDADLTTDVTVNVQGTDPRQVTAFFVRAINNTQGSREEAMTFTKQADGTWVSSYTFKAPGTYYLRYVRLDGVDYALAEPQKVEVSGFAVERVTCGDSNQTTTIRTSDNTYSEDITVKFAASDPTKLPKTVQAQFVREDGNFVNVPLTYSSSTKLWTGTAVFATSGQYTLKYLTYDNLYKDLSLQNMTKTLDLTLGMYVAVYQNGGQLTDAYESGKTYSKNVWVEIFDDTGKELEPMEGAVLYYSNGGSATGTINTNLTWNHVGGYYEGTLPIVKPGRYRFASVKLENNYLTKCTEGPVYTVISPDPPQFDTTSEATYHSSIQFVPLTNDAVMDNIKIDHAESAAVKAVVYNDISRQFYTLDSESRQVVFTGNGWSVKLPSYTLDVDANGNPVQGAVYTQEGTWSLVCLILTDCYDASSSYRDSTNPIIWAGNDSISNAYLNGNHWTADEKYDFSKLSTTVSCSIKVSLVPGTTTLGSTDAAFMSRYPVRGLGMYALLTDEAGRIIPKDKVADVTLNVKYTPSSTSNTYGYKVLAGAGHVYVIGLNTQDDEDGHRTVSAVDDASDFDWQYVGVYSVQNLQVTIKGTDGNITKTYRVSDNIGLPEQYTITTAGPSAANIALGTATLNRPLIGKVGDNVVGTFLQGGNPNVQATVSLTTEDDSDTRYVILDDVAMKLILTYQGGSDTQGGYTIVSTSDYQRIEMTLTNQSGTYVSSDTPLLAGTYKAELQVSVGGGKPTSESLPNVSVWSKQPTLKVTGVGPVVSEQFKMNTYFGNGKQYYDNAVMFDVQNYYTETLANVYIKAESTTVNGLDSALVDYTLPEVTLALSDIGTNFGSASVSVPNSTQGFSFSASGLSSTAKIGTIGSASFSYEAPATCGSGTVDVPYETQTVVGEQTITSISITDKNGAVYTMTLSGSGVTIREKAEAPASISYVPVEGYTTPTGQTSTDGGSLTVTLPTSIGTTTKDEPKGDNSAAWTTESDTTQNLTYYELKSCVQDQAYKAASGCSSATPAKYTATFTYHLYTRRTKVETTKTITQTIRATYGLKGWIIGDKTYAPGETITINGVVTATPVIDIISETPIGDAKESTVRKTTITDTFVKTQDVSKQATSNTSNDDAKQTAEGYYTDCKPSGYNWFDASNPANKDAYYKTPYVKLETLSS